MSGLITSIEEVRKSASESGWKQFCAEYDIDPVNPEERAEGVMIDSFDLLRYGMDEEHTDLVRSVKTMINDLVSD